MYVAPQSGKQQISTCACAYLKLFELFLLYNGITLQPVLLDPGSYIWEISLWSRFWLHLPHTSCPDILIVDKVLLNRVLTQFFCEDISIKYLTNFNFFEDFLLFRRKIKHFKESPIGDLEVRRKRVLKYQSYVHLCCVVFFFPFSLYIKSVW